jgi:uncharacterized protein YndB with AHSA1/START domain
MVETANGAFQAGINAQAPVVGSSEIEIAASPDVVWEVLTTIERWPSWNPDIKSVSGPVRLGEGSDFAWKAGPGTIKSTIQRLEPPQLVAWTGRTMGLTAIHFYRLEPRNGWTFVRTEESYDGITARLFRRRLQKILDRALTGGLRHLKAEAERQTAQRTR